MAENMKDGRIELRVSKSEKRKITKAAQELGISRNEYILRCVRNKKIIQMNGFDGLMRELNKIGVNINQIAAKVNTNNYLSTDDVKNTQELMLKCFQMIFDYVDSSVEAAKPEVMQSDDERLNFIVSEIKKMENEIYQIKKKLSGNNNEINNQEVE